MPAKLNRNKVDRVVRRNCSEFAKRAFLQPGGAARVAVVYSRKERSRLGPTSIDC